VIERSVRRDDAGRDPQWWTQREVNANVWRRGCLKIDCPLVLGMARSSLAMRGERGAR
jgi:hypothetical protein